MGWWEEEKTSARSAPEQAKRHRTARAAPNTTAEELVAWSSSPTANPYGEVTETIWHQYFSPAASEVTRVDSDTPATGWCLGRKGIPGAPKRRAGAGSRCAAL